MTMVERAGEVLARRLDRRKTMRRAAAATFGLVAAWATQGIHPPGTLATHCRRVTEGDCTCNPPGGRYCSGCSGSRCPAGCVVDNFIYGGSGCWCTAICDYGSRTGYYKCCDCKCGSTQCACRKFHRDRS